MRTPVIYEEECFLHVFVHKLTVMNTFYQLVASFVYRNTDFKWVLIYYHADTFCLPRGTCESQFLVVCKPTLLLAAGAIVETIVFTYAVQCIQVHPPRLLLVCLSRLGFHSLSY
ncbi:hypothetical protein CSKR_201364 [Clonorchis sinensis]|uniref:Uncharacterized protein n=1 Tax=Clonorchis sinensis TaxID=79923 RepID=A0A8T1MQ72_CLOSI|nr:hypothetical protein CSKR_201364 [Clonorchis sinensis]